MSLEAKEDFKFHLRPEIREEKVLHCLKEVLTGLLDEEDMSPRELSHYLGVPWGRVKSWLDPNRGKYGVMASWEVWRCARLFKVPVTYLLYGIWEESYEIKKRDNLNLSNLIKE